MKNVILTKSYLLFLAILVVQPAFAQWKGPINTAWYNEQADEFTISTAEQLAGFAKLVNDGNDFRRKTVKLGKNIALNNTSNWKNWASKPPANQWTPIGLKGEGFRGTFDGNGKIISGIYMDYTDEDLGLFRCIGSYGIIKNLGVTDSYIKGGNGIGGIVGRNKGEISNSHFIGTVVGRLYVGGLVGWNSYDGEGIKISSSYFSGTVSGYGYVGGLVGTNGGKDKVDISNSYSIGSVTGKHDVGGLVGINGNESTGNVLSTINSSYSTCTVNGENDVGGLVGSNRFLKSNISNSYSTGTVKGKEGVGGLVGRNRGNISGSYSTGAVTGDENVGGLVGRNEKGDDPGNINNSYSTSTVVGDIYVGGLVGKNTNSTITNSYSAGIIKGEKEMGGLVGYLNDNRHSPPPPSKINKSYYNKDISNQKDTGKGEGKSTAEMKQSSTFAGWDFKKTWGIDETVNNGYPHLLKKNE